MVPSVTEIIYLVGGEGQLLANTTFCDYPQEARRKPKVGDFAQPDLERIVALRPRLVVLSLPTHQLIREKLTELGVPTYCSQPRTVEGILAEIDSVGRLLGRPGVAARVVDSLRRVLDSFTTPPARPAVYVEISMAPLMTAGGSSFLSALIARAGGRNVFADIDQEYPLIAPEQVVVADPEVMLVLHPGRPDDVAARVGWSGIRAVRNGRIYTGLDEDLLVRPGPRVVTGIALLRELLQPTGP